MKSLNSRGSVSSCCRYPGVVSDGIFGFLAGIDSGFSALCVFTLHECMALIYKEKSGRVGGSNIRQAILSRYCDDSDTTIYVRKLNTICSKDSNVNIYIFTSYLILRYSQVSTQRVERKLK